MNHLTDEELMLYLVDRTQLVDCERVEAHIESCAECRERLAVELTLEGDLRYREVWNDAERFDVKPPRFGDFLATAKHIERENADAERRLAAIFKSPMPFEKRDIVSDSRFHTAAVVRKLCAEAERLHARSPRRSFEYASRAATIAAGLGESSTVKLLLGIALREEATALRFLGKFKEGLRLLDNAELILTELPGGAYDLAVAWYVRASLLVQFGEPQRTREALVQVRKACDVLTGFADNHRLLRARALEAVCLLHLGQRVEALAADEEVISLARRACDQNLLAYGLMNAADVLTELRELPKAERYHSEALALFDELGITVESVRNEWLLARVSGMRGALRASVESLASSREKLFELGLLDDHALATLDWSEFRLALDEPSGVAEACREIILRYESESMTRNARLALAHLQEALRKQSATPELVREVREYLTLLPRHPDRPFAPSPSALPSQKKY